MPKKTGYYSEEWRGQKYGRLTILRYCYKNFECLCDCGKIVRVRPTFLLSGRVKTCGNDCEYHLEERSGFSKEKLYSSWYQMIYRCHNPKSKYYAEMQKRQIEVCEEWRNDFWAFKEWADKHGYEPGLCLTRIRKSKSYTPDNCKWITKAEIARENKLKGNYGIKYNVLGEMLTMQEVCKKYDLTTSILIRRMRHGMTMEQAATAPKYSHTPDYFLRRSQQKSEDVTMLP